MTEYIDLYSGPLVPELFFISFIVVYTKILEKYTLHVFYMQVVQKHYFEFNLFICNKNDTECEIMLFI